MEHVIPEEVFFGDYKVIDVHGHYGIYLQDDCDPLVCNFMSATASEVADRARTCDIEWTLVSPMAGLLPRGRSDSVAANEAAYSELHVMQGLLQYVIVNPLQPETFDQAQEMLKSSWCIGIKIHPEEHGYHIKDYGEKLFSFFEKINAPVMTHSGCPNSLPADFVPFANQHPGARVILAHLGNGSGDRERPDLQVRAVQEARYSNLWVDTSSARSIIPGLIEWAVREIGAEKIMFGSDTPINHVALQCTRIGAAEIASEAKRLILSENALHFFNLSNLSNPK